MGQTCLAWILQEGACILRCKLPHFHAIYMLSVKYSIYGGENPHLVSKNKLI